MALKHYAMTAQACKALFVITSQDTRYLERETRSLLQSLLLFHVIPYAKKVFGVSLYRVLEDADGVRTGLGVPVF